MSVYHWIDPKDYTMETFLFFDRWVLRYLLGENTWYNQNGRDYKTDLASALSRYPHVAAYCRHKAPECSAFLDQVLSIDVSAVTDAEAFAAQCAILEAHETFVVYAYPKAMEQVNYIRNWREENLHRLLDLEDKVVLDVGAGTGRLSFAAAKRARRVYASEPCDMLREYMRDVIRERNISNVRVLDGFVAELPFEDDTFDAVLSGHVVGDDYDAEITELMRVVRDGGYIVCCNGDDEFKREGPNSELVKRGFEYFSHETVEGGIVYDYRMKVIKS